LQPKERNFPVTREQRAEKLADVFSKLMNGCACEDCCPGLRAVLLAALNYSLAEAMNDIRASRAHTPEPSEAYGTTECPICGSSEPHNHQELEQKGYVVALNISNELNRRGEMSLHELAKLCGFHLAEYERGAALSCKPASEAHPAQMALEHDRTKVAECITAVKKALGNYDWLITSRGSYEWNDDRWHEEFKRASENIREAIEPMVRIAADWTHCPKTQAEIEKARAAQPQPAEPTPLKLVSSESSALPPRIKSVSLDLEEFQNRPEEKP
jgi:hypothetical protein